MKCLHIFFFLGTFLFSNLSFAFVNYSKKTDSKVNAHINKNLLDVAQGKDINLIAEDTIKTLLDEKLFKAIGKNAPDWLKNSEFQYNYNSENSDLSVSPLLSASIKINYLL